MIIYLYKYFLSFLLSCRTKPELEFDKLCQCTVLEYSFTKNALEIEMCILLIFSLQILNLKSVLKMIFVLTVIEN